MSFLVSPTIIPRARLLLPAEVLARSFQSSPIARFKRVPSRLRLADNVASKPSSSRSPGPVDKSPRASGSSKPTRKRSGKKKTQRGSSPPPTPFVRDAVPHPDAKDLFVKEPRVVRRREDRPSRPLRSSLERGDRDLNMSKGKTSHPKYRVDNTSTDEFDRSVRSEPVKSIPSEFTSPPLMPGLLDSVVEVLGPHGTPTAIQGLAIKHMLYPWKTKEEAQEIKWREFLLASETGSGKSLAYMLPLLQDLKTSELGSENSDAVDSRDTKRMYNPRAIVLAPTHELSRQLTSTAKSLSHNIRLRVLCTSRANVPSTVSRNVTASKMSSMYADASVDGEFEIRRSKVRGLDVLVGTPSKVLEMIRGHGWNWDAARKNIEDSWDVDEKGRKIRRKEFVVGQPQVGLHRVEWVVVDEADVLFDPDFQESTRMLLSDIAAARGKPVVEPELASEPASKPDAVAQDYPYNLILTSATIPTALAKYLDKNHPRMKRLVSPKLHHLPSTLKTEHVAWTGGNHNADIESRIKRIWYADVHKGSGKRSKVLVFCNKSDRVQELGRYLAENDVPNIALTSTAEARHRGNNHHLDGFMRTLSNTPASESDSTTPRKATVTEDAADDKTPHVLITTSLLSRGLDFSPEIKNVLIVDAPRNMIDFIHRAGRTARAGARGTVIIFGKAKGRGAGKDKEVLSRLKTLL